MKEITYVTSDPDNEDMILEVTASLPAEYKVCGTCHGSGVQWPAAFSNGFTSDELNEDPDFKEDLLRGNYDVPCRTCDGQRVELEIVEAAMTPEQREHYEKWCEHLRQEHLTQLEYAAERRMGA
jgi:hypothetical protein